MFKSTIENLITASNYYPSGDNCQPYKFRIHDDSVDIEFQSHLARHELDFLNLTSGICLGGVIRIIELNASRFSLTPTVQIDVNPQTLHPQACIRFTEQTPSAPNELALFIPKRRTYRGDFKKQDLPPEFIHLFEKNRKIKIFNSIEKKWVNQICDFETDFWSNVSAVADLTKLIHFDKISYKSSHNGLYWRELYIRLDEMLILKLFKHFPSLPARIAQLGAGFLLKQKMHLTLQNSSLALFLIDDKTKENPVSLMEEMIEVGRSSMEFWLTATQFGLSAQPISMAAFSTFYQDTDIAKWASHKIEFNPDSLKKKTSRLAQSFQIPEGKSLAWMFRLGHPLEKHFQQLQKIERERYKSEDIIV